MLLNEEIKKYKEGDTEAAGNIFKILHKDINAIVYKYQIPGHDKDDKFCMAMEEVLDCLTPRQLLRGTGIKKIVNENDSEIKNRNFIKAAINYRFIRELRATKSNIRISYDIPYLQENGQNYLDRKGKPLYVGVIFHGGIPYLIEDKKNTKVVINISQDSINKNDTTFEYSNPIDAGISLDMTVDDDDNEHEVRDVFEFSQSNNDYLKNQHKTEVKIMSDVINGKIINKDYKVIIKNLLEKSKDDMKELEKYVKKNIKQINQVKCYLGEILL